MGKRWLITGGAGFIGFEAAKQIRESGDHVILLDDFSRARLIGGNKLVDLRWAEIKEAGFTLYPINLCEDDELSDLTYMDGPDVVLHLAAQTAVTHSITDPRNDFARNVQATVNLLEFCRTEWDCKPHVIYASTNKVFGNPAGLFGPIGETQQISPRTPYGVSKAAAAWYCLEYHRSYGLSATVFHQSCIYGETQVGSFGQGWMAHIASQVAKNLPVTICGTGDQVRDALHVTDLVAAYQLAAKTLACRGQDYVIGGGPSNTTTVIDWCKRIAIKRKPLALKFESAPERPNDQAYFVADTSLLRRHTGWKPSISIEEGGDRMIEAIFARHGAELAV